MAEPIIDKLRKLFALADEKSGATEGEREAAAAQAAKLMAKYDIDRSEVGDVSDHESRRAGLVRWREITREEIWMQMLATAISIGLGDPVEVLSEGKAATYEVYMIGSEVKVEFVRRLTEYLIPQLQLGCEAALLQRKEEYAANVSLTNQLREEDAMARFVMEKPKPWTGADTRKFRQAYLKTAAMKLKDRIGLAYREETTGTGTDLVVRGERDEVEDFMDEHGIKPKQRKTSTSSREGRRAGMAGAASVDITPGAKVGAGGGSQLTSGSGWPD